MYKTISPSGYQYTIEPTSTHPFWSEGEELMSGLTYTRSSDNTSDFDAYEIPSGVVGTYKFNFEFKIEYEYEDLTYSESYVKTIEYKLTTDNIDFKQNLDFKQSEVLPLEYLDNKYIGVLLTTFINFTYEANWFTIGGIEVSLSNVNKIKYLHIELVKVDIEVI